MQTNTLQFHLYEVLRIVKFIESQSIGLAEKFIPMKNPNKLFSQPNTWVSIDARGQGIGVITVFQ